MRTLVIVGFTGLLATPVLAQHENHAVPAVTPETPVAAAAVDPHAGHVMPAAETAPAPAAMPATHDMNAMGGTGGKQPEVPPPPAAFSGPAHAADTIFAADVMARSREIVQSEHGDIRTFAVLADQLESHSRDDGDFYLWDVQGWYGGDINKLWLKSEGEGNAGESPEHAEVQALWSHAVAPFWNFQAGIRNDFRPESGLTYAVVGFQGLMPYKFGLDAAAFVSEDGNLSTRLEAEYEFQITQRLILQPRAEMDVAAEDVPALRMGSGITSAELGLRLRYEIVREFAPYIGLEYGRSFGGTANYARALGENVGGWSLLVGIRTWF